MRYIFRSEVKRIIELEDSSIEVRRILLLIFSNEGDRDFNEYMDAINESFDKYSKDGIVVMANSSDAYIGDL